MFPTAGWCLSLPRPCRRPARVPKNCWWRPRRIGRSNRPRAASTGRHQHPDPPSKLPDPQPHCCFTHSPVQLGAMQGDARRLPEVLAFLPARIITADPDEPEAAEPACLPDSSGRVLPCATCSKSRLEVVGGEGGLGD